MRFHKITFIYLIFKTTSLKFGRNTPFGNHPLKSVDQKNYESFKPLFRMEFFYDSSVV